MRILLIGKTGQVGYGLHQCLHLCGEVIAPDRSQMDLGNTAQVQEVIRLTKPNLIINAAAYTNVDRAEGEPYIAMQINAHAPEIMAVEARKIGAAIIHYSTDYVFDGTKGAPYVEEDLPNPINVYGASKLAGEQAIQASGASFLILRTSWVYGSRRSNFVRTIQRLAKEGGELNVVCDQFGTPTHCQTIIRNTLKLIEAAERGKLSGLQGWQRRSDLFHLSDIGEVSRYQFAKAVVEHMSLIEPPDLRSIRTTDLQTGAQRPRNSALSCEKLEKSGFQLVRWTTQLDQYFASSKSAMQY